MDGDPTKDEVIEQVRAGLLRMMESNRKMTRLEIARRIGCRPVTLKLFLIGDRPSLRLAIRIVAAFPEAGDGLGRCPHCGGLPVLASLIH